MKTLIRGFAEFISKVQFEDLTSEAVTQAKNSILDLIGVAVGGLSMEFPQMVVSYLASLGGKQEAMLIGSGTQVKVPAVNAALGNGVCAHALEMDDGYRFGGVHTGATVIPAVVAGGEVMDVDGKTLILGTVLGFEIQNRLSRAMNPSHLGRGFHTTGTLGTFGAAAGVGKVYGLDEKRLTSALGLAGLQGAGLLEILNNGAMVKPIHPGKAAMAGLFSVELAKRGAQGPATVLEGEKGLFKAMADEVKTGDLLKDLGEHYLILDQYTKLHAACRHTHPAIDAALQLEREHAIEFKDISEVHISTYPVAVSFCGAHRNPNTPEGAKFSLPFSVSLAIYYGDAGMNRYCVENVEHREIQNLASNITVNSGERWANLYPDKRGASVEIKTKDGNNYSTDIELAKGEPENPASIEDLVNKFRNNTLRMPEDTSERLMGTIMELEKWKASDLSKYFYF